MLPHVINSAEVLRDARARSGLSRSALASKAGVPTSTVSRIEVGSTDPSLTMLRRLVHAAGSSLVVESRPRGDRFTLAELATAVDERAGRFKMDWTRIRGFVDWVEQHPNRLEEAIADPPASTVHLLNVILAALAEQLATEHDTQRPRWTRAFGPLDESWSPPSTPRMLARFEESAPEPFRRRNIALPRSTLFRSA